MWTLSNTSTFIILIFTSHTVYIVMVWVKALPKMSANIIKRLHIWQSLYFRCLDESENSKKAKTFKNCLLFLSQLNHVYLFTFNALSKYMYHVNNAIQLSPQQQIIQHMYKCMGELITQMKSIKTAWNNQESLYFTNKKINACILHKSNIYMK